MFKKYNLKFLPLIKTFYENIKLNAMIFMIRFEVDIFESDPHPGKNSIINDEGSFLFLFKSE